MNSKLEFLILIPHLFSIGTLGLGYFIPIILLLKGLSDNHLAALLLGVGFSLWYLVLPILIFLKRMPN